ncbi:nucleoside/nucleotide kinase family protein [Georgenia faecalis]|uniref:Nucleoside/nucleotide kinase family protein n=1 Tax=Georgenia faecalis TaxID=2483799 RepID=A0ABV9DDN9_9MICO|nr:nucleoside/nucleotide kinase family protein [Georgenia faecalis]
MPTNERPAQDDVDSLVARARRLAGFSETGRRRLLGVTGSPGAGKSTLTSAVVAALAPAAVLVPMDGFHLANAELERLGRRARKGAPDTFDAAGYVALLRRLRAGGPETVYAPLFDRHLEEAIAGAIPVPAEVPLVVTEGNYLLHGDGAWSAVRPLLDEVWFVEIDDDLRVDRLIQRHVAHGKSPDAAREWVLRSDEANAALVARTRDRADVVVRV